MKFHQKMLALCLTLVVLICPFASFAEESSATAPLPCGVRFGMSLAELSALLGEDALVETWDDDAGTGSVSMETSRSASASWWRSLSPFRPTATTARENPG